MDNIRSRRVLSIVLSFIFSSLCYSKDYTSYNNLVSIAKKCIVAKRYIESDMVFEIVDRDFHDFYKSIDLYYWAIVKSKIDQKRKGYKLLLRASRLSNDQYNIYFFAKNDSTFSYLKKKDFVKIKDVRPNRENKLIDSFILSEIKHIDSVDSYWQSYYIDSVFNVEVGSKERNVNESKFASETKKNSLRFCELICNYGYPGYNDINRSVSHLLYHLNRDHWVLIESFLIAALKNGKLEPFDYAYAYLRTHDDDRYGAKEFIELESRRELQEKIIIKEKGTLGLGI